MFCSTTSKKHVEWGSELLHGLSERDRVAGLDFSVSPNPYAWDFTCTMLTDNDVCEGGREKVVDVLPLTFSRAVNGAPTVCEAPASLTDELILKESDVVSIASCPGTSVLDVSMSP